MVEVEHYPISGRPLFDSRLLGKLPIGTHRDGEALRRLPHGAAANEFRALLRPYPARARVDPGCTHYIAAIGARSDNAGMGAVWVFTRTADVWAQQGSNIVNRVQSSPASVALNADASTAAVADGSQAWVYVP